MNALGRHLLIELHGCEPSILDNIDTITDMMVQAASLMCVTVLNVAAHKFEPQGVTAIVMIAESHLSIHTWPEYGYAAVDIFTCNGEIPDQVQSCIAKTLKASQVSAIEVKRGVLRSGEMAGLSPGRQGVIAALIFIGQGVLGGGILEGLPSRQRRRSTLQGDRRRRA